MPMHADERPQDRELARDRPAVPSRTALLVVDVQNRVFHTDDGQKNPWFRQEMENRVIPNIAKLIAACRETGAEVIYTVMENLTKDGRDRSLDYKLSGIFVPKGSWDAKVVDAIAPGDDDILLPKTSSGVFNSTVIEYLLRNIGIEAVAVTGVLTDQCVDHAIKDGADRGFYMICIADACATHTQQRHDNALAQFRGYCRTTTTDAFAQELKRHGGAAG
jgi:nicotinamidase-related amidase